MKNTITVTSKGQATFPAFIREKLGLPRSGGKLRFQYNEETRELVLKRPETLEELSSRIDRHRNPDTQPLEDVDSFYKSRRGTDEQQ